MVKGRKTAFNELIWVNMIEVRLVAQAPTSSASLAAKADGDAVRIAVITTFQYIPSSASPASLANRSMVRATSGGTLHWGVGDGLQSIDYGCCAC